MSDTKTDILGRELTEKEAELLRLYEDLKKLSADKELAPCALMNVRQAMVMMWNACNDLGLCCDEPGCD